MVSASCARKKCDQVCSRAQCSIDPGPELGKEENGEEVRELVATLKRMRERTSWVVCRVWERVGRRDRRGPGLVEDC